MGASWWAKSLLLYLQGKKASRRRAAQGGEGRGNQLHLYKHQEARDHTLYGANGVS